MVRIADAATIRDLEELAEKRHRDPNAVLDGALACLAGSPPARIEAAARWVLGLALHELSRIVEAIDAFRLSIAASVDLGWQDYEAKGRASLARSLVSAGQTDEALKEIGLARLVATPATVGLVEMLAGLVMQRTGLLAEAQACYDRALGLLESQGDVAAVARLRANRGVLRAYIGDGRGAAEDLAAAEELAADLGLSVLQAGAAHNLGFAHGRLGDVAKALMAFTRADQAYSEAGRPQSMGAVLEADRCEVLLSARLIPEARQAARQAVRAMQGNEDDAYATECRLLLARVLLASGSFEEAREEANVVAARFRATGRPPWAALADYVGIQADFLLHQDRPSPPPDVLLERCRLVARELDACGWPVEAAHVRTYVGRLAIALGRPEVARAELSGAQRARTGGSADLRAEAWHAVALLHVADGNPGAARRAISNGLRVVEDHLSTLGVTELRVRAASHGDDLARLGVRLALGAGKPAEVLRWSERWRAESLRRPSVLPPADDRLSTELDRFRQVGSELRQSALEGTPTDSIRRRVMAAEAAVRQRLLETASAAGRPRARLELGVIRRRLGRSILVEYLELDGELFAVTLVGNRSRLFDLGSLEAVEAEQAHLAFALKRLFRNQETAPALVQAASDRLDQMLLAPLRLPSAADAVLVPTASLMSLPWGCLPGLARRTFTVAPSAAIWAGKPTDGEESNSGAPLSSRVLLVAGPGLPGATTEVGRLSEIYPGAGTLVGPEATTAKVLDGLVDSDILHLAAHGTYRADSPMFSSFLLADGPLTVHDLERAQSKVQTVVLASCEAGVSGVIGREVIGTAAALLGMGATTVVAPVISIPDVPTAEFMVEFHRQLRIGLPPSSSLSTVRRGSKTSIQQIASVFLCIGSAEWDHTPTVRQQ